MHKEPEAMEKKYSVKDKWTKLWVRISSGQSFLEPHHIRTLIRVLEWYSLLTYEEWHNLSLSYR